MLKETEWLQLFNCNSESRFESRIGLVRACEEILHSRASPRLPRRQFHRIAGKRREFVPVPPRSIAMAYIQTTPYYECLSMSDKHTHNYARNSLNLTFLLRYTEGACVLPEVTNFIGKNDLSFPPISHDFCSLLREKWHAVYTDRRVGKRAFSDLPGKRLQCRRHKTFLQYTALTTST